MDNLNDFKLPEELQKEVKPSRPEAKTKIGRMLQGMHQKCINVCTNRFGESHKITHFVSKLEMSSGDDVVDAFSHIKKVRSANDRLNATLTIILIIIMVFTWNWGLPLLDEADQLVNDLGEQEQIIGVEKKNNASLSKWEIDREKLESGIRTVYAAIPDADEKAEDVISILEGIGRKNRMVIDAIGIRKMSESQMYYDDLIGKVDIYEYTFTLESTLPNILSFIRALRQSLRLMDIMAMEIEENKGLYRASFLLNAYHITNYEDYDIED